MIDKECIDEAIRALKGFSDTELKDYAKDVMAKAKTYKNMSNASAFQKAMNEINDERLREYFESTMTAANNAVKIEAKTTNIRKKKANVQNVMVKLHGNLGDNVTGAQSAAREQLEGIVFNKVSREQVAFLSSGENDLLVADAFDEKKVESKDGNFWAKLWKDVYFPERNAELITSNAMPFNHVNEDRSFRNIHDPSKMMLGGRSAIDVARSDKKFTTQEARTKWIESVKKNFDLIHSDAVDEDGNINMKRQDEIIGGMYDNITTGKSDIYTRSLVVNDRIAIQNKSRRRLQPKSMRNFVEYNREYGQGNLFNAMLMDMQTSANKIGMARQLGDSPHVAYFEMRKAQQESNPKESWWWHQSDLYFEEVMGTNKTAVSPTLAAFDANTRAVTAMARLMTVAFRSLPDTNYMATFAMNHGVNYFEAWGHHLKNMFDLYPSEDRKFLAKSYASMFRQQLGYMARYGEVNNMSDRMNKISTGFFKWNGLHGLDNSQKMSGLELVAKGLGRHSSKSFNDMPLATQNWVAKFMSPEEWDLLRGKTQKKMFTVDNVNALTDKELKAHYETTDQARPLLELRNDLYRRVHAMSQIATENMVLNPGAFEKAFLLQGTKPGTPTGVLLRQLAHFKSYTLSYVDKILIQGYKTADSNQQKLAWATATLVGAMPLAYGVMFFDNLGKGKSMPDITKMGRGDATKFLLELMQPGLALFSGVLDPKHQNADMVWSLLASPSLRLMGNAMSVFFAPFADHPVDAAVKRLKSTLNYIAPINTTPILSPLLNEAMGEKGYVEPGQKQYFGK
jgi:hypothetical protein